MKDTSIYKPGDRVVITDFIMKDMIGWAGKIDWYYGDVDAYGGIKTYSVVTDKLWHGTQFIRISEHNLRPEEPLAVNRMPKDKLRGLGLSKEECDEVLSICREALGHTDHLNTCDYIGAILIAAGVKIKNLRRILRAVKELSNSTGLSTEGSAELVTRLIAMGYLE